jgi:hypothetical protein
VTLLNPGEIMGKEGSPGFCFVETETANIERVELSSGSSIEHQCDQPPAASSQIAETANQGQATGNFAHLTLDGKHHKIF